jgi:hypothetical protein
LEDIDPQSIEEIEPEYDRNEYGEEDKPLGPPSRER